MAPPASDGDRSSRRRPHRVWLFVDSDLFDKASDQSAEIGGSWQRFYELAKSEGRLFRASEHFSTDRVAVELDVLSYWCGTRTYGERVSVSEFVCGMESSSSACSDDQSRNFVLSLTHDLFARATGFEGIELESSWCRLWCLAEARRMVGGTDTCPTVKVLVPL